MTRDTLAGPAQLPDRVADALDHLVELVAGVESETDERVQERLVDLLRAVDLVHRAGLRRLHSILNEAGLLERALDDPSTRLLYELYDLGSDGDRQRADAVLDDVRPYIESHGGQLTVLDAADGEVTVRLSGACGGCTGSPATLGHVIEEALRAGLPDFVRLVVDETPGDGGHIHATHTTHAGMATAPAGLIPVESLRRPLTPTLDWRSVAAISDVPPGTIRGVQVEGLTVLLVNLEADLYAYRDACPEAPLPLAAGGRLDGATLVCPWHGCRFDARGGRRLDAEGAGLSVMPIAIECAEIRIGILRGAAA